jgi:YHS domain-containing protein
MELIYGGRAFYFESRDNRDAFEADPEKYVAGMPFSGEPVGAE